MSARHFNHKSMRIITTYRDAGAGLNFDNQPQRAGLFTSCRIGEPMITRRHLLSAAGDLVAFSATPVVAVKAEPRIGFMEIKRNGSQPSGKGSADYFTGTVRIDPLFQASEPARGTGASVTFEPGARTSARSISSTKTSTTRTGLSSPIQSSRHSGNSVV